MEINEKILVPLDGSPCAENILPVVEELSANLKAHISLLRVAYVRPFPINNPTDPELEVVREAERYLRGIGEHLKAKGFTVECQVRYGQDAEEIIQRAAEGDISLIALSNHGDGGMRRFLLGSVAEKLIRHAPKPIFLVHCPS
jgi:nucleotide-binding universal stress UspA family protein